MAAEPYQPKIVQLQDVDYLVRRRPAVLVGPSFTIGSMYRKDLMAHLELLVPDQFRGHADIGDLFEALLQESPDTFTTIRDTAFEWFRERQSPHVLGNLI